jgi:ABC-type transport system involved in Fe-S cluster assembly fused permease/ATPase subunit
MSIKQNVREGGAIAGWWLFGVILVIATVVMFALTWSGLAPWAADRQREVNENSQSFQDAQVRELRNLVIAINTGSEEQQQFFTQQFCTQYVTANEPPADLVLAHGELCQ